MWMKHPCRGCRCKQADRKARALDPAPAQSSRRRDRRGPHDRRELAARGLWCDRRGPPDCRELGARGLWCEAFGLVGWLVTVMSHPALSDGGVLGRPALTAGPYQPPKRRQPAARNVQATAGRTVLPCVTGTVGRGLPRSTPRLARTSTGSPHGPPPHGQPTTGTGPISSRETAAGPGPRDGARLTGHPNLAVGHGPQTLSSRSRDGITRPGSGSQILIHDLR